MAKLDSLHYVDFSCQGESSEEVIAEVARHVHAFNREHDNVLGLDFPAWTPGQQFQNAQQIRVLGEAEHLSTFLRQPRAVRLLALGEVARTALSKVPDFAELPTVAVVRDSSAEKTKPSHARRRAARGLPEFDGKHAKHQFALSFTSKSTGQAFLLKLKKRVVERLQEVQFTSYGICARGGIPQF